jgi:hypothetical protein
MENQIIKTEQKTLTKISNEIYWQNWQKTVVNVHTPAPELYRQNLPALSSLDNPTVNGVLTLQLVILEILDFIGVEWDKKQTIECSELAYQEYHWFNIGELKQFSQRVKTGYFGKIYGKFAPAHLMEYFGTYANEMLAERADYYGKKRVEEAYKQEEPLTDEEKVIQEKYLQYLRDLSKKLSAPDPQEAAIKEKEHKESLKRHMDFFKSTLTPEQLQDMEDNRIRVEEAVKKYEQDKSTPRTVNGASQGTINQG